MPGSFLTIPTPGVDIGSLTAKELPSRSRPEAGLDGGEVAGFADTLGAFITKVDQTQQHADAMVEAFALGEPVEIHRVIQAVGEAQTAIQLTVQVRNKVLEAYQEIMRMQI